MVNLPHSVSELPQVPEQNPFEMFLKMYREDPVRFVREVLGAEPDEWQCQFLNALAKGHRRISIRSGHGVGKSTAASWAIIWYILTRIPVKIVVTAPTESQLYDALFAEMKTWIEKLPEALRALLKVTQDRVELAGAPDEAFISARTSRAEKPEALAGVHSAHVMLIADEASGIPESVFEAASGSMSGHSAVTILLGNPVRTSGLFYETHHQLKDSWWTLKVSCLDSSRVSDVYAKEQAARFGIESNAYRVRVLGEFPRGDNDTVIPLELVEGAMQREVVRDFKALVVWGVDVAYEGDDYSTLCKRQGACVFEKIRKWSKMDTMQTTGVIKAEWDAVEGTDLQPTEILVDAIGFGAGVADRLRELGLPARGINVSETPAMKGSYRNLRAELWFKCKAWLEARQSALPKDDELLADLVSLKYFPPDSNGRILLESKREAKKRLRRSPDVAEALIMTFASEAGIGLFGSSFTGSWSKPIRRRIAMV